MKTPDNNIYTYDSNIHTDYNSAKVHYCHGAPGAVSLYILSYIYFKNKTYMDFA